MSLGYYEAHALWMANDEAKARDLEFMSWALDQAQAVEEYRTSFKDWVRSRQPRRYHSTSIPKEVLERFREAFNNG